MLKLVTYNIHKGVQAPGSGLGLGGSLSLGLGWGSRLEIHNIARAVASLDADVVCLQEVRSFNHQLARRFQHWPEVGQAQALAPQGYHVIYQTNARTRHGEHGNALLSRWPIESHRHEDISDHAFEQRGVLQVKLNVKGQALHVVVVHLGLFAASRLRQIEHIKTMIAREIPADEALIVAGAHRCANPASSGCHPNKACSAARESAESDTSHSVTSALHAMHLGYRLTSSAIVQLHTNHAQVLNGDIRVSNGTQAVIPGTYADTFYAALKVPGVDVRGCNDAESPPPTGAFCGETNAQGLASNGAEDACFGRASSTGGAAAHRFVHVEQSFTRMSDLVTWEPIVATALATAIPVEH